jgi:hypothetical protein
MIRFVMELYSMAFLVLHKFARNNSDNNHCLFIWSWSFLFFARSINFHFVLNTTIQLLFCYSVDLGLWGILLNVFASIEGEPWSHYLTCYSYTLTWLCELLSYGIERQSQGILSRILITPLFCFFSTSLLQIGRFLSPLK